MQMSSLKVCGLHGNPVFFSNLIQHDLNTSAAYGPDIWIPVIGVIAQILL
jgi:hypothetical protein